VAVLKEITGADTVAGHVPRSISSICSIFLRQGGSINSRVNGHRHSSDLPQGGLEIPCVLTFSETFSAKSNNESDKVKTFRIDVTNDGTVLLNVPLGSGNSLSNSCEVFGTGFKYFRIDIFNT